MELSPEFIKRLAFVHPKDYISIIEGEDSRPHVNTRWELVNEIRPVDLYCYLGARFGQPNGLQNFLRNDSSDNLIHWEWVLRTVDDRYVTIQGQNFRTEVWISGSPLDERQKDYFVELIKSDFPSHGAGMKKVRDSLEHWTEFVNPYQRVRGSIMRLKDDVDALRLDAEKDALPNLSTFSRSRASFLISGFMRT